MPVFEETAVVPAAELTPSRHEAELPAHFQPVVIEARPGWKFIDLGEMWRYRELLYFLVWRDVKVRYKQTVLGVLWAIIQPVATMVIFSLFFSRFAQANSGPNSISSPYPLFVFAGLLPWTFFANAISQAGGSIVGNQNLVTKVYFPRLFIPLGTIGAGLVDLVIAFGVLMVLMLWYQVMPSWNMLLVPLMTLDLIAAALGVGVLLSALTVAYRDFRHVVPFMVQLWMFATPCVYMKTDSILGPRWERWLPLNPAFGIIENFRAATLGTPLNWYSLSVSTGVALVALLTGCFYFRRVERSFADII